MADRRSEYIGIGFALQRGRGKPGWSFIPHSRADGIAGFHEYLGQHGYKAQPAKPATKLPKPRFYAWPLIFLRSLGDKGPYSFLNVARFRHLGDRFSGDHTPVTAGAVVFSETETRNIAILAQSQSVPVNSYLLAAIHPIVYETMTDRRGPLVWFIPVDLRPWLKKYPQHMNIFSAFTIALENAETATGVHEKIGRMFSRQVHWFLWLKLRFASRLGIFEHIAKRRRKTEFHFHDGKKLCAIFSNLGSWQVNSISGKKCPPLLFSPPPNASAPVAAGAVTVNGRLTLTLRVHPALQVPPRELNLILKKIHKSLKTVR